MSSRNNRNPNRFEIDMTPLHDFMRQMDSFFNNSFKQMNEHFQFKPFWVDVTEDEKQFIIEADLDGYTRDQIQIEVTGNQLRIGVEDHEIEDEKDSKRAYHYRKQRLNKNERVITLPFDIPKKETKASFRNHVLVITIPKQNSARNFIDIDAD
ncbi:Hsp20/alpha crystallin family protein [Ornithinibacillus xuwenensis]|uniref:Hsp20/alpha crystallin family protein n=1 Tax=Ornithinibacillus xuwenensis TaxID=3144668 RepID=A0ABU9XF77_9BACI